MEHETYKQAQDFEQKLAEANTKMAKELEQARQKTESNQKHEGKLKQENKKLADELKEARETRTQMEKQIKDLMGYNSQAKNL